MVAGEDEDDADEQPGRLRSALVSELRGRSCSCCCCCSELPGPRWTLQRS